MCAYILSVCSLVDVGVITIHIALCINMDELPYDPFCNRIISALVDNKYCACYTIVLFQK